MFHQEALAAKPADMSVRDYMYNVAIGTDYAIDIDRYRYCARVPLDRGKMQIIIRYLNGLNEPYRTGQKVFHWNVLRDNCTYLAHNALGAVGLWPQFPIDRPLLIAAFDFPVPKNEFVNVMWRTNDMPIADPSALYDDDTARDELLQLGWIATEPGALAEATPEIEPNEIYNDHLRLIFYDEPVFGHFQKRFDKIFAEPRYTDLTANLEYFSQLYASILAEPRHAAIERDSRSILSALLCRRHQREAEGGHDACQTVRRRRLAAPHPMPLLLRHFTIVSSIGAGLEATLSALRSGRSGLRPCAFETVELPTYVGEVEGLDDIKLPEALASFDCRNNRLAEMALREDGFRGRCGSGGGSLRRAADRPVPGHQHVGHPARRTRLSGA